MRNLPERLLKIAGPLVAGLMPLLASAQTIPGELGYGPDASAVPTLGEISLLLLGVAFLMAAYYLLRRKAGLQALMAFVVGSGLCVAQGPGMIQDAIAVISPTVLNNPVGGTVQVGSDLREFQNVSGVQQRIRTLLAPSCAGPLATAGAPPVNPCAQGALLAHGESCATNYPGCAVCTPNCSGLSCGSDGCGGSCGSCGGGFSCVAGACVSAPPI